MSRNQELEAIKKILAALDKLSGYDAKRRVLDFVNAQPLDVVDLVDEALAGEPLVGEATDPQYRSTAGERFA